MRLLSRLSLAIWRGTKAATAFAWERAIRPGLRRALPALGADPQRVDAGLDRVEDIARRVVAVLEMDLSEIAQGAIDTAQVVVEAWLVRAWGAWGRILVDALHRVEALLGNGEWQVPPPDIDEPRIEV